MQRPVHDDQINSAIL